MSGAAAYNQAFSRKSFQRSWCSGTPDESNFLSINRSAVAENGGLRTAGLVKLHCGADFDPEGQVWAGREGGAHAATANSPKIDAVNFGSMPKFAARSTSVRFR
ncbi:hypothetical protein [Roseivivax sediminis]|uniref:hypothetical protein n=1 Tax=Roseivivax sediminis TaxID=936889 RepID=UPI00122D426E|nr:hypothetical protein [Roseivivax sediminis]